MAERVVTVAGMHRSGTSMFARLLHESGIHMGDRLHVDRRTNPHGHYEDEDFLGLQRRELARAFDGEDYRVAADFELSDAFRAAAANLVERRREQASGSAWGWKDPRTTLFLPLWKELIPELEVVGLVRSPRDVFDSLCRRTRAYFSRSRKEQLLRTHAHYSRRLLDHVRAFPETSHVVSLERLLADPDHTLTSLGEAMALRIDPDLHARLYDASAISKSRRASVLFNRSALRAAESVHEELSALAV